MIFSSDLVITQDGPTHQLMLHTLNMNMFCEQHRLFYWTITTNQKKNVQTAATPDNDVCVLTQSILS